MKNLFLKVAGGVLFLITFSSCKPKVEVTPHFHSFCETWTSDAENHWHEATCEHDVVKEKSTHNWDSGKITESPTCIKDGVKTFTCEICRREKSEILEKSGHDWDDGVFSEKPTEETDGIKTYTCKICGIQKLEIVENLGHTHKFAEIWSYDETNHWHAVTCDHTEENDKTKHNFGEWIVKILPTELTEGIKERECFSCGYKVSEAVSKVEHTHSFGNIFIYDDKYHWHAASCEHIEEVKDKIEHIFGEWISNHDSTNLADGTKSRNCIVCLFKETVVDEGSKLPKTDYSLCVVGDYILKDGTVLSKNETPESSVIAAVIVREASEDKPCLGVGIWQSRTCLRWCTKTAEGYNKNITALQGNHESGYMDGRNGWKILKETCSDAEEHPEYYPAWNYSLTYAETNGLKGDLAKGWYFPTASELYTIYLNKETIDASLSKAACDLSFSENFFWSCSQRPNDLYAWGMSFGNGNGGGDFKHLEDYYVCSVKAFE